MNKFSRIFKWRRAIAVAMLLLVLSVYPGATLRAAAFGGERDRHDDMPRGFESAENNRKEKPEYQDHNDGKKFRTPEWSKGNTFRPEKKSFGFKDAVASATHGDTIEFSQLFTMTESVDIDCSIRITGADKLDDTGCVICLSNEDASVTSDGELNVASGVDGCVAVRTEDTYTLREIAAPATDAAAAGSKVERTGEVKYLFLDLDPHGVSLDAFRAGTVFADLSAYTLDFSIEGNDGTALIKTSDRMTVTAYNADGNVAARITYVVIVMGDTNCNGIVNTSDVVGMKSSSFAERGIEVQLAADTNLSGVAIEPKVNSSDAVYIMNKCFMWETDKYVSNLK